MKRILSLLLLLSVAFCLLSCAKSLPNGVDEEHYNTGKSAINIVDSYLDFKTTRDDAGDRLDALYDRLKDLPEASAYTKNDFVRTYILTLSINVRYSDDTEILTNRNTLAEYLDIPKK